MANVQVITDENGNIIARREYNAFGEVISQTGEWPSRFGYHSNWIELKEGLYLTPTRIYSTELGRFIQKDRSKLTKRENLYEFCDNNPSNKVDASGNDPLEKNPKEISNSLKELQDPNLFGSSDGTPENLLFAQALNPNIAKQKQSKLKGNIKANQGNQKQLEKIVVTAALKNKIPSGILLRIAAAESSWNPKAVSAKKAVGLMQFMPATANQYGLKVALDAKGNPLPADERFDPAKSADAAARYLNFLYSRFPEACGKLERWKFALAAYNWGRKNVNDAIKAAGLGGKTGIYWKDVVANAKVPMETQNYVKKILGTP